ncbi:MAG: hypothetical protein KAR56_00345 [Thermoplasmata archaeon]|nr:hypothetical protein [Thermoplasmata archaeon]
MKIKILTDPEPLLAKLAENLLDNSGMIFKITEPDIQFDIFADEELTAAVAIQKDSDHCMFWGDWHGIELPRDMLPKKGIFVSACAPDIIEILKQHFELDGEWPCWHYLAPDGYGPGEWDKFGSLTDEEVSFVAEFWELGGDGREEHVRDRVNRLDSACIRENGQTVAWCGLHFEINKIANLGFAHTLDEHRRKGYAGLVTKALVNRLSVREIRATSHVMKDNKASMALCGSLNFENIGELTWAYFKR